MDSWMIHAALISRHGASNCTLFKLENSYSASGKSSLSAALQVAELNVFGLHVGFSIVRIL